MSQENTIPYASGSVRPSWINRRAHGAGLRLVAIAAVSGCGNLRGVQQSRQPIHI